MIVYCNVEECRPNRDGRCGCVWPVGVEAIRIEQTPFGVECMDGKKASIVFPIIDPDSLSIELSRVEMRGDVGNNVIETGDIVCKIHRSIPIYIVEIS